MLFQILKQDLRKRKGINVILFLFITLATVFLASSVNNILVTVSAVDYYMDYANVPDVTMLVSNEQEKVEIQKFLKDSKTDGVVDTFDFDYLYTLPEKDIRCQSDTGIVDFDAKGRSLYLGTMDVTFSKAFDEHGKTFQLKDDEIALPRFLMEKNQLQVGDHITLQVNGTTREYTIALQMKDLAFGNEMTGMGRLMVNEKNFDSYEHHLEHFSLYSVSSKDAANFQQKMNQQGFSTLMNMVTKDTYKLLYSMDMIMAGMLTLIGICLILIALLVLRFTLVFTMEEQYQEIGILKAIGLREFAIRKLYLLKYLFIVSLGALIGLFASLPISDMMMQSVNQNMIVESSETNIGVNILCAVLIVVLVLAFCSFCTRRLRHISAISAIRGNEEAQRYARPGLRLHERNHMPVFAYLGINDILSHLKRYIVLIITFCISFILITIPLNTLETMRSTSMLKKFNLDPDSAVYLRSIEKKEEGKYNSWEDTQRGLQRIKKELKDAGYDANLKVVSLYFLTFASSGTNEGVNVLTSQYHGNRTNYLDYEEGSAPQQENEIAVSVPLMKANGWIIGDMLDTTIDKAPVSLLITGSYTDYMQMGNSIRLNPKMQLKQETMFDYWAVMVDMESDLSQKALADSLQKQFPEYEWLSGQELVNENIGGIQDMLEALLVPMTAMLCGVIMLITLMMERLFITREKGEIAMMKSCGFRNRAIRQWQLMRMICVVGSAMLISIPLSLLSNYWVLRPIFAIMGATMDIVVNPVKAYILYPGILLIGILMATLAATRSIKRISIREMNNLE